MPSPTHGVPIGRLDTATWFRRAVPGTVHEYRWHTCTGHRLPIGNRCPAQPLTEQGSRTDQPPTSGLQRQVAGLPIGKPVPGHARRRPPLPIGVPAKPAACAQASCVLARSTICQLASDLRCQACGRGNGNMRARRLPIGRAAMRPLAHRHSEKPQAKASGAKPTNTSTTRKRLTKQHWHRHNLANWQGSSQSALLQRRHGYRRGTTKQYANWHTC
jgi:hypothetical protein